MKTMKKFWKYFILFILLFLFVSGMTYLGTLQTKNNVRNVDYSLKIDIPVDLNIEECQATTRKGHVKGNVVNHTGELMTNKYLQFSFYNSNNYLLRTEFEEIKYFNVNEKIPFDITVPCENINKVVISLVDESTKQEYVDNHNSNILSGINVNSPYMLFGGLFALYLVLP